jgi:regulator of protease activity HflC (stomatin/prohibitin superfamily)
MDKKMKRKIFEKSEDYGDLKINWDLLIFRIAIPMVIIGIFIGIGGLPFSIVGASERGIRYLFGAAQEQVLEPGLQLKVPFVGQIRTWSIEPNKLAINIPIDDAGAISKDNQIIGIRLVSYWQFDPDKLYTVATTFPGKSLENLIASQANASAKTVIGRYTIFDLAANQETIGGEIQAIMNRQLDQFPIILTQLNISNFDWSKDFDKQINATMEAAQRVRQAEQNANIAEQENKRLLIEAEAKARAQVAAAEGDLKEAELKAQARIVLANAERDAKIAEGDGIRQYNISIAQNQQIEFRVRELEIQLERAKRWDGREVPTYLPLNPAGGIVTLPVPTTQTR